MSALSITEGRRKRRRVVPNKKRGSTYQQTPVRFFFEGDPAQRKWSALPRGEWEERWRRLFFPLSSLGQSRPKWFIAEKQGLRFVIAYVVVSRHERSECPIPHRIPSLSNHTFMTMLLMIFLNPSSSATNLIIRHES